jgi:hypothetical protein
MSEKTRNVRTSSGKPAAPVSRNGAGKRPFANAHLLQEGKLSLETELRVSQYTVRFMDSNAPESADRMRRLCGCWKAFLSSCGERTAEDMREPLKEFIGSAFSLISHCHREDLASQMLSSAYTLMDFAPSEVFSQLAMLCATREPDGISALSANILLKSSTAIPTLRPGDVSLYSSIEYFANQLEAAAAAGVGIMLEPGGMDVFIATASTYLLEYSGLCSDQSCLIPQGFESTIAYGILFGVGFSQEERLRAIDQIPKTFSKEGQVAAFSRIYGVGTMLPTMAETEETKGYRLIEIPKKGPLLQIWKTELGIREKGPRDIRVREQMISSARGHLDSLGVSPLLPGKEFQAPQ